MSAPARAASPAPAAKPVAGPKPPGLPYVSPMLPDPHVCFGGRFHVYPRADGMWIVYDAIAPFAKRTVEEARTMGAAKTAAEHLAKSVEP